MRNEDHGFDQAGETKKLLTVDFSYRQKYDRTQSHEAHRSNNKEVPLRTNESDESVASGCNPCLHGPQSS